MPRAKPHSRNAYSVEWFWHDDPRRSIVGQAAFPASSPANLWMRVEELTDEGYGVIVTPPGQKPMLQQTTRLLPAGLGRVDVGVIDV